MRAGSPSTVRRADDHAAAAAWRAFAGTASRTVTVESIVRGHKSAVYRLHGARAGAPAIIAKAQLPDGLRIERAVYRRVLPQVPVPTLRCYGTLETRDGSCWIFLEDACGRAYSPWSPRDRALAARWLAAMHAATAHLSPPPSLPRRNARRYRATAARVRERLTVACGRRSLASAHRQTLIGIVRQLDALDANWHDFEAHASSMPSALMHGDFCAKNLRVRAVGGETQLAVFDWDSAAWGVCAPDLALATLESASPSLHVYWQTIRRSFPRLEEGAVRAAARAGAILRLIDAMEWELARSGPRGDRWAFENLRWYYARMRDAIGADRAWRSGR